MSLVIRLPVIVAVTIRALNCIDPMRTATTTDKLYMLVLSLRPLALQHLNAVKLTILLDGEN